MVITKGMRAVEITQNGGPEVLKIINCPIPTPEEKEILIKFGGTIKPLQLNFAKLSLEI